MGKKIGILVMSYGTPENMEDVEAYYTHIRRGNPPQPQQLEELLSRYDAIGGFFPLRENTNRQVAGLEKTLNTDSELEYVCYQGLKHAAPYIEDAVAQMAEDGIRVAVGVVLAPHYSTMSVGSYNKRAQDKAEELGINIRFIKSYHLHPKLLQALSQRVNHALNEFNGVAKDEVRVIFSAHSLPQRILEMNDPYVDQLMETAGAIAGKCNISNWQFAWQSAGQTDVPWLGPDILEVLKEIAAKEHVRHVLMCPIGFVSDHLEVLYDIDIECQQLAKKLNLVLRRTPSLNTDPLYMEVLADVVQKKLKGISQGYE